MKMFMKQINCKVSSNKSQNKQLHEDGPSNKSTQWLCSNFALATAIQYLVKTTLSEKEGLRHPEGRWLLARNVAPRRGASGKVHAACGGRVHTRGPRQEVRVHAARNQRRSRSREVLARKPAKEERRPILEPGGPGRCSRLNALQCTVSLLPVLCQGGARSTITIAAAPILYAWYPQAGEADDIHRLLWWKRTSLTNGVAF